MTDSRPRPQYGEYATPEVQAKAMGLPAVAPDPPAGTPTPAPEPVNSATEWDTPAAKRVAPRGGLVNQIVTLALLALGLVNVLSGISTYLSLPTLIQTAYDQLGVGRYTATALASMLGIVAIAVSATVWTVTAWICVRLLRRARMSWWVPLLGAAVTALALAVILSVAVLSDPAFSAYTAGLG